MHQRNLFITSCLLIAQFLGNSQSLSDDSAIHQIIKKYQLKNIELSISDMHCDNRLGLCYYYLQQEYDGIPIFGYLSTAVIKDNSNELMLTERLAQYKGLSEETNRFETQNISDLNAIKIALQNFQIQDSLDELITLKANGKKRKYKLNKVSGETISISETYIVKENKLVLSKQVSLFVNKIGQWWELRIDSKSGKVLDQNSWTIECSYDHILHTHEHVKKEAPAPNLSFAGADSSYLVFAAPLMNPDQGVQTEEIAPWNISQGIVPSPFGWHDLDGISGPETTITQGNNVYAYPDRDNNNSPDNSGIPDGGTNLIFDSPVDLNSSPSTYVEGATTNLFYWNNIIHDVMYNYGFDEAAGNFQNHNYGRGGISGDYVKAEAQDGSGTNNANFSTPPDGSSPRMQMYEWSSQSSISFVVNGTTQYTATGANFGPETANITGSLIQTEPNNACGALTNSAALIGKVAVIDRGDCKFVAKTLNAQSSGAIAVVICNYNDSNITMGGDTSATISIPSIMLSQSDCQELKITMAAGSSSAEININDPVNTDSDLDNGVIIHEYGHGISIRLTGGASTSSCLNNSEQMGEGWSDFLGLIMTIKAGDHDEDPKGMATYLSGQPTTGNGIRAYPYTTDLAVNPFSYADISGVSVPHGVGSVWATMLWEMTWALINEHGFDPDLYNGVGGNNMALQLVMTGLKLQPCSPGFVDGRDAILMADQLINGGANQCIIWNAFAKRGLGYSADQGSSGDVGDSVEAFDLPPSCSETLSIEKYTTDNFVSIDDTIHYNIEVTNNFPTTLNNVLITDTLSDQITYIPGSLNLGQINNDIIVHSLVSSDSGSFYSIEFDAKLGSGITTYVDEVEDFENALSWEIDSIEGGETFQQQNINPHWGSNSIFIQNVSSVQTHTLQKTVLLPENAVFTFWHRFNTENKWDGGLIEISVDGGSTWDNLQDNFILNGYPARLIESNNGNIGGKFAFTGNSEGYQLSAIDLSAYSNKTVDIRFLFGSDGLVSSDGWYIDDITIYQADIIMNTGNVMATNHAKISNSTKTFVLPNCIECQAIVDCEYDILNLTTFDKSNYRAENQISASALLGTNENLRLMAGNSISLDPNFEIPINSTLIVEIDNCGNSQ